MIQAGFLKEEIQIRSEIERAAVRGTAALFSSYGRIRMV